EAQELPEEIMLGSVVFGHQEMQAVIQAIRELAAEAGKPVWDWQSFAEEEELNSAVRDIGQTRLQEAYQVRSKQERQARLAEARNLIVEHLTSEENPRWSKDQVLGV